MYIFELINKLKNRKNEPGGAAGGAGGSENVENAESAGGGVFDYEIEDASTCEHVFMPIDSTKTILACSKCGFVIKNNKKAKKICFFVQKCVIGKR